MNFKNECLVLSCVLFALVNPRAVFPFTEESTVRRGYPPFYAPSAAAALYLTELVLSSSNLSIVQAPVSHYYIHPPLI